jgi:sugar lactone lactonase YvrE
MTVDSEGNLYIIRWGAPSEALLILSAEGKELAKYPLKASAATAPCFCGPNLKDLVITSAEDAEVNGVREADLFRIEKMPIAGKNEFYSRILI